MSTAALILITVLATSILSGVLGMAGGMVLMGVLAVLLGVASAMVLHGAVQATSNASRALFLRQHIRWSLLPIYLAGSAVALALFWWFAVIVDTAVLLIVIGSFPFLARGVKQLKGLDITRPGTNLACGFVVTSAQLIAGVSGPILDVFYLNSPLNRFEVVASKAITQTVGHLLKLLYYGVLLGSTTELSVSVAGWLVAISCVTAIGGARIGTRVLERFDEALFRRASGAVILAIGAVCVVSGLRMLWQNAAG